MNKRILFYYTQLNTGGAEKSLVRMMNALRRDGNETTLLTRYGGGSAEVDLDKAIRRVALSVKPVEDVSKAGFFTKARIAIDRIFHEIELKLSHEKYDLAVIGLQGLESRVITRYVNSDKIAQCVRSDVGKLKSRERVISTLRANEKSVDAYLCVSEIAKESLTSALPQTRGKAHVLYNFLDVSAMRRLATDVDNPFPFSCLFNIVSVCRVEDTAKGVFRMLNVAQKLHYDGYSFQWTLVGDGPDYGRLQEAIAQRNAGSYFVLVGKKSNPFPYYKYADLVAVPSYYEGLSGVVNEAKVTGAAVLATEFSGVREQLTHGVNGWIVENDEASVYQGIKELMDRPDVLRRIKNDKYPEEIIDDAAKLRRLYSIMGWS